MRAGEREGEERDHQRGEGERDEESERERKGWTEREGETWGQLAYIVCNSKSLV